jgi:hypothetical protein
MLQWAERRNVMYIEYRFFFKYGKCELKGFDYEDLRVLSAEETSPPPPGHPTMFLKSHDNFLINKIEQVNAAQTIWATAVLKILLEDACTYFRFFKICSLDPHTEGGLGLTFDSRDSRKAAIEYF